MKDYLAWKSQVTGQILFLTATGKQIYRRNFIYLKANILHYGKQIWTLHGAQYKPI